MIKNTVNNRLIYNPQANTILNRLTLEEKISLMSGWVGADSEHPRSHYAQPHYNYRPYPAGGLNKENIPPLLFCDGPRGVVCQESKNTCFPVPMLRGASFNPHLEEQIGQAIAKEVKASGGNFFGGVCINLLYHPGWGRSQETYGEESFHLGIMGSALVRSIQSEKVLACIKHFAFNQMEISRFKVDIHCDKRTEREVFLPHFKKCVEAGAAAVMSAYNKYLGILCGHHEYLLRQVLKKEWKFDGFVINDFIWGIRDTVKAVHAGVDVEMEGTIYYGGKLLEAVNNGNVSEDIINDATLRIIRTLLAFGYIDNNPKLNSQVNYHEHAKLALESARQGITLVQNKQNNLPWSKTKTQKIVVLGRLGNEELLGDHGSSRVYPPYVINPIQGLANISPSTEVVYYKGTDLQHACKMAREADAVVFIVGLSHDDEGEYIVNDHPDIGRWYIGGDRSESLKLHGEDIELIQSAGKENPNSTAVLIGGSTILIENIKEHVSSILMAYYPGMEGGTAIAEIIYGDINPSGKLPFVIPVDEEDLPAMNWNTTYQHYDYYHGYTKLEKEEVAPSIAYGFGLSYTTFELSDPIFTTVDDKLVTKCKIQNTGAREGAEVIQLYVGFSKSKVDRPVKILRGFQRIFLKPEEKTSVTIECSLKDLCYFNEKANQMQLESMQYEVYLGTSSRKDDLLEDNITIP